MTHQIKHLRVSKNNKVFAAGSKLIQDEDSWKAKETLTEQEVNLIKRRLNAGKLDASEMWKDDGWKLTPEQNAKGKEWLFKLYKTPRGVERENMPYGYRETAILDSLEEIRLKEFYDAGNAYVSFYVPEYVAYGAEGSFEYYVSGGEIHIIG